MNTGENSEFELMQANPFRHNSLDGGYISGKEYHSSASTYGSTSRTGRMRKFSRERESTSKRNFSNASTFSSRSWQGTPIPLERSMEDGRLGEETDNLTGRKSSGRRGHSTGSKNSPSEIYGNPDNSVKLIATLAVTQAILSATCAMCSAFIADNLETCTENVWPDVFFASDEAKKNSRFFATGVAAVPTTFLLDQFIRGLAMINFVMCKSGNSKRKSKNRAFDMNENWLSRHFICSSNRAETIGNLILHGVICSICSLVTNDDSKSGLRWAIFLRLLMSRTAAQVSLLLLSAVISDGGPACDNSDDSLGGPALRTLRQRVDERDKHVRLTVIWSEIGSAIGRGLGTTLTLMTLGINVYNGEEETEIQHYSSSNFNNSSSSSSNTANINDHGGKNSNGVNAPYLMAIEPVDKEEATVESNAVDSKLMALILTGVMMCYFTAYHIHINIDKAVFSANDDQSIASAEISGPSSPRSGNHEDIAPNPVMAFGDSDYGRYTSMSEDDSNGRRRKNRK